MNDEFNSLFAYHFAPFWARFCWLEEYTSFPDRVRSLDGLADWLDRTLEGSSISKTLPDPDWAREVYEKNYVG